MVSLISSVPAPEDSYTYRTIVQDKFTYALNSDSVTFALWKAATEDKVTYNVPAGAETNAAKFSEFIISWKCNSAAQKDGCCMVDGTNGAVCTMDMTADGTAMTTYRMTAAQWTTAVAAFATN